MDEKVKVKTANKTSRFGDEEHATEVHRNLKPKMAPCHSYDPKYGVYKEPQ